MSFLKANKSVIPHKARLRIMYEKRTIYMYICLLILINQTIFYLFVIQEFFERKKYASKVQRAQPGSPIKKKGISQDLLSLHMINRAHAIGKKGYLN